MGHWTHTFRCDGCKAVLDTETQRLREAHEAFRAAGWKQVQPASGGMRGMKKQFCLECLDSLPAWARSDDALLLLAHIIDAPPATFIRSADDWQGATERFTAKGCKPLAELRRMHREWEEREFAALDAQFHVTGHWDQDASNAIHRAEDADALVRRLLTEPERADLTPKELPNGGYMVAA
jgi:hypothetical protein